MNKSQIIDYYDQAEIDYKLVWDLKKSLAMHYGFWDSSVKNFREALKRENEVLAKMARIKKSDLVLDAGCGVGGSAIFLAKRYSCQVIGITLSKNQVQKCKINAKRQGVSQKTQFFHQDFTKTKFPKETFDVVWAIESVCHADSKEKFIKEAYRILKKGGRLIMADFLSTNEHYAGNEQKIMDNWLDSWKVISFETSENFKKYMQKDGFKKVNFKNVTPWVLPSSKRLHRLFYPGFVVNKIGQLLGLRNEIQTKNLWSAYYQYQAFKKKLAIYGIFYAEK